MCEREYQEGRNIPSSMRDELGADLGTFLTGQLEPE
jgi:hypothetical protein